MRVIENHWKTKWSQAVFYAAIDMAMVYMCDFWLFRCPKWVENNACQFCIWNILRFVSMWPIRKGKLYLFKIYTLLLKIHTKSRCGIDRTIKYWDIIVFDDITMKYHFQAPAFFICSSHIIDILTESFVCQPIFELVVCCSQTSYPLWVTSSNSTHFQWQYQSAIKKNPKHCEYAGWLMFRLRLSMFVRILSEFDSLVIFVPPYFLFPVSSHLQNTRQIARYIHIWNECWSN